jgi:peptidoglycan/LPS O-acetylase OafA/YrhL
MTMGAIIVGLLYAPTGLANRLLRVRPLRELGIISYGLLLDAVSPFYY